MLRGNVKLIGISGRARCGKDTLAAALVEKYNYKQFAFATPIYKMLNALPYLEALNSDIPTALKESDNGFYGKSPRKMLQTLGTEWGRNHIHPNIWIWIMEDALLRSSMNWAHTSFVISDLRFPNEADWLRKNGGLVIRIHRGHEADSPSHESEQGFKLEDSDVRIANDGSIEQLQSWAQRIDVLAEERRDAIRR